MKRPNGANRARVPFYVLFVFSICLCFSLATKSHCLAAERVNALNYTEKLKQTQTRSPQEKMGNVLHYLHGLSEAQLLRLTHEIGGEVFLYQILAERSENSIRAGAAEAKKARTQSRHRLKQKELVQTLQVPEIRERYFDAVANYLLNSDR